MTFIHEKNKLNVRPQSQKKFILEVFGQHIEDLKAVVFSI